MHRPDLRHFYRGELSDIRPGDFEFTLDLLRGSGLKPLNVDDLVTDFSWADEEAVLTGALNVARDRDTFPFGNGHLVRCRVRWNVGKWYELWQMRVQPDIEEDAVAGSASINLQDDLSLLQRNKRKWVFRKTKARGRGWRADEIAREVAKREKVRIGKLAKGTKRTNKLEVTGSGLEVIKQAYANEKDHSGRKFIIRMRNGKLEVVPYRRNSILYVVEEQLEAALLHRQQAARPVTVIEARGKMGKEKVKMTVFNREVVRRFGRVTEEKDYGKVDSRAELRTLALRDLAAKVRITRTADLSIPGIPFIRRGDGMRWRSKEPGWYGPTKSTADRTGSKDRTFVYVTTLAHSVASGGEYTTDLSIVQEDPFVQDRNARDKARQDKARAKREARKN